MHINNLLTNTELRDIMWLMGYRNVQWYIKDTCTWIGFSAINIAKQAIAHHTFMASQPEMAQLLPVARKWLRKWNFWKVTDMASDPLSIPR